MVHGDLPGQHSFGTTLRFTGPDRRPKITLTDPLHTEKDGQEKIK